MAVNQTISGKLPSQLANAVTGCVGTALQRGMQMDEALCVILGVVSDLARVNYGDCYLGDLCDVLRASGERPVGGQVVEICVRKGPEGHA